MTKKWIGLGVLVVAALLVFFFRARESAQEPEKTIVSSGVSYTFERPKKSAHYESNTPAHGAILPAPPVAVVVDVNFDLTDRSSIVVEKDGKDYGEGATTVDNNKLAMRRAVQSNAPDGLYTIEYKACWPDQSCHMGRFQFVIDRASAEAAVDLRAAKEVDVRLAAIAFAPKTIRIRRGTKVTWRNDEPVEHYINTDSHPAHTYYPAQNSRLLKQGDTYALVFDTPGAYPYHCSAHAQTMTGMILVE